MAVRPPAYERSVLLLLCLLVIALNIGKPIHIDDGWHIRAAKWIAEHPLRPMSGKVQWNGSEQYFHEGNNPPLLFYGLAAVGTLLRWNEWALHLFISLFGVFAIHLFRRITIVLGCRRGLFLTAVLASSPAFLVTQNLMLDVPLLAFELWFLLLLLRGYQGPSSRHFIGAALVLGLAVLIKYSLFPLILVLGFSLWRSFKARRLWIMSIPMGIWALWSLMNVLEFGVPHMMGNVGALPGFGELCERLLTNVMIMGSILPAAAGIGVALIGRTRWQGPAIGLGFACIGILLIRALSGVPPDPGSGRALVVVFTVAGALLFIGLIVTSFRPMAGERKGPIDQGHARTVIGSSALLLLAFNMVYAPFMAPRHMLLLLPLVLLIGHEAFTDLSKKWSVVLISGSFALCIWMAVSDHRYASFYKDAAVTIANRYPDRRHWHQGVWGWGWYSEQAGSTDLARATSPPRPGDIIATAIYCVPDVLPSGVSAHGIDTIQQELSFLDVISTRHWAKFYCVKFLDAPWNITSGAPEMIIVREVE